MLNGLECPKANKTQVPVQDTILVENENKQKTLNILTASEKSCPEKNCTIKEDNI